MTRLSALAFSATASLLLSGTALAGEATPLVDTAWLQTNLDAPDVVVLDIRNIVDERDVHAEGHIPGSVAAPYNTSGWRATVDGTRGQLPPLEDIQALIESFGVDNDEHVVIVPFGETSTDFGAATRIYWTFKVLGHDAVSILDGGYVAWNRDGGALSTQAVTPTPGTFQVSLRDELLATADEVEAAQRSGHTLVDGRPQAQYEGTAQSGAVARAGTIPGAVNLEQSRLYDGEQASYADAATVAAIASQVGVEDDASAITFCNTGHWASVVWFGLSEIAGRDNVAMYDGSMTEWTADPQRPVVAGTLN